MTKPDQDTALTDPINLLLERGLADGLPRIAEMLMNAAMCLSAPPTFGPNHTSAPNHATATPTDSSPAPSTPMAERLHREVKRRSTVASLFPNEASVLRLVTAIHIEVSEDWETGRAYLTN